MKLRKVISILLILTFANNSLGWGEVCQDKLAVRAAAHSLRPNSGISKDEVLKLSPLDAAWEGRTEEAIAQCRSAVSEFGDSDDEDMQRAVEILNELALFLEQDPEEFRREQEAIVEAIAEIAFKPVTQVIEEEIAQTVAGDDEDIRVSREDMERVANSPELDAILSGRSLGQLERNQFEQHKDKLCQPDDSRINWENIALSLVNSISNSEIHIGEFSFRVIMLENNEIEVSIQLTGGPYRTSSDRFGSLTRVLVKLSPGQSYVCGGHAHPFMFIPENYNFPSTVDTDHTKEDISKGQPFSTSYLLAWTGRERYKVALSRTEADGTLVEVAAVPCPPRILLRMSLFEKVSKERARGILYEHDHNAVPAEVELALEMFSFSDFYAPTRYVISDPTTGSTRRGGLIETYEQIKARATGRMLLDLIEDQAQIPVDIRRNTETPS